MKTQLTIIGTNHGKGTSRIWLEGKRLVEAGFEVGTRYDRSHIVFVLEEGGGSSRRGVVLRGIQLKLEPKGKYKVSGKGDKPIIDISGGAVTETFAEHISVCSPKTPVVEVNYSKGLIAIQPAGCR
jgi:hypothetical protein